MLTTPDQAASRSLYVWWLFQGLYKDHQRYKDLASHQTDTDSRTPAAIPGVGGGPWDPPSRRRPDQPPLRRPPRYFPHSTSPPTSRNTLPTWAQPLSIVTPHTARPEWATGSGANLCPFGDRANKKTPPVIRPAVALAARYPALATRRLPRTVRCLLPGAPRCLPRPSTPANAPTGRRPSRNLHPYPIDQLPPRTFRPIATTTTSASAPPHPKRTPDTTANHRLATEQARESGVGGPGHPYSGG